MDDIIEISDLELNNNNFNLFDRCYEIDQVSLHNVIRENQNEVILKIGIYLCFNHLFTKNDEADNDHLYYLLTNSIYENSSHLVKESKTNKIKDLKIDLASFRNFLEHI